MELPMDGALVTTPAILPIRALEAQITELAGHLNAATYRWLMLIAEYDRRKGWADGFLHSCAHWLNFKCGVSLGAAREKLRVAHALPGLPKIAAAMARGELSYSKVRAVTRVATPGTEEALLNIALHGTAHHVERTVNCFRHAMGAADLSRERHQQQTRSLTWWTDSDGSLVLKARLPALAGAMLLKALEAAQGEVPNHTTVPYAARRADALALVAEGYMSMSQGEGRSSADHHQVVIHVDAETLKDHAPGRCHLEEGPALPVATIRRLTCDASLVRITEDADGEPLDVGRKTRTIPPAIRRALRSRDEGCCFPGCTFRRHLDAHHVKHWVEGGETKLSNLLSLCRTHHRKVHEGGIRIERCDDGAWRFLHPDGEPFVPVRATPYPDWDGEELQEDHAAQGLSIDANTAATRWRGEAMDYDHATWLLCHHEERWRAASSLT
jgi:hypothetical protein